MATIRAAGSNGIAAITWAGACRRKTHDRSNAGRLFAATFSKSGRIVSPAICCVARGNVRQCFTGLTTPGRFRSQCSIHNAASENQVAKRRRTLGLHKGKTSMPAVGR